MVSARLCCLALLAVGIAQALKTTFDEDKSSKKEQPDMDSVQLLEMNPADPIRHMGDGHKFEDRRAQSDKMKAIDEDGSPPSTLRWQGQGVVLSQSKVHSAGERHFDDAGIKDPSVVYYDGNWHVFYTGSDGSNGTIGYVKAPSFSELNTAPRHAIEVARGNDDPEIGWGVAPQIFYFEPHKKWYLLFQSRDAKFQPMFCTNSDISNPNGWSKARHLLEKPSNRRKWIDFWLIADKSNMYLFYTETSHPNHVAFRTIPLPRFPFFGQRSFPDPKGWSEAQTAIEGVHEAAHIYKVVGKEEYHMVYEFMDTELGVDERLGGRSFRLAAAPSLAGPWSVAKHAFARAGHIVFAKHVAPWTDIVSHGEAIRTGYNQNCEYDPADGRWLIQGINSENYGGNIGVPYYIGIIQKYEVVERPMNDGRVYQA